MTTTPFNVIIPARYGASRFPGKPLAMLGNEPMIQHVHRRAVASGAQRVVVATDDSRIEAACTAFGAEVVRTTVAHPTGTDRLAEAVEHLDLPPEAIVVNLQGDEPLMPPAFLAWAAKCLEDDPAAAVATLAVPITSAEELLDPAVVKVVCNALGHALYFSRAPIPWDRERFAPGEAEEATVTAGGWLRHLGLYAYRVEFLKRYPCLQPAPPERLEALEQLRALWHGFVIQVATVQQRPGSGVDTPEDLDRVAAQLGV
ncbi:MAG: 3-deoxy-manno-octulosonate cytidylyltransferase [Halorhodospira sp.]